MKRIKGSYILIIQLKKDKNLKIGSLGKIKFKKGYYAYVGSGMNNLQKRIERHLNFKRKKLHWHIDYLLKNRENGNLVVRGVYFKISKVKEECKIAEKLSKNFSSIENFGSSDCKCKSHLFYSKNFMNLEKKIKSICKSFISL